MSIKKKKITLNQTHWAEITKLNAEKNRHTKRKLRLEYSIIDLVNYHIFNDEVLEFTGLDFFIESFLFAEKIVNCLQMEIR